ncbi:hypothetical protein [Spirosoma pulveris]
MTTHLVAGAFTTLCLLVAQKDTVLVQTIDTSKDRVKTDFSISLPRLGSVKPRSIKEIESSTWLIDSETMDRDFTDYDQYKEYSFRWGSSGCGCSRAVSTPLRTSLFTTDLS